MHYLDFHKHIFIVESKVDLKMNSKLNALDFINFQYLLDERL